MIDPLHARDLIVEDALQSRGLILDNDTLIEQERELDEDLKEKHKHNDDEAALYRIDSGSSSGSSRKGKGRSNYLEQDSIAGYDHVGDGHDREASTSSRPGRGKQHPQSGYDEDYEDDYTNSYGANKPVKTGYQVRHDKRRHRQPHINGTPSTSTNTQAYDSSLHNNETYHNTNTTTNELDTHERIQYREDDRATDRLLGSILARDPMKELEADSATRNKPLTKEEVRAAHWRSIFISCLFVLAW